MTKTTKNAKTAPTWQARALAATRETRFGAILACALGVDRDAVPRFDGKASVTSDGFVMCNFVDKEGRGHFGAFVGSASDLESNVRRLSQHLKLSETDAYALDLTIRTWVGKDWRARRC